MLHHLTVEDRRWDGEFRTLRQLVAQNAFDKVVEAELHYDFENPSWIKYLPVDYTPGAGMLFGLGWCKSQVLAVQQLTVIPGSHTLDQALVLFGRPKSVTAFLRALRGVESDVDDTFTVILQYDSPLLVTVKTSIVSCLQQDLKYFIRGTGGSYIKVYTIFISLG